MLIPQAPKATVQGAAAKGPSRDAGLRSAPDRAPPRQVGARKRVLLIEDDFMLRQHMAELLTEEGYHVSSAADGADALLILEREPLPAAIILDIVLPRMSGLTFREVQLESPMLRNIPTIVVSATTKRLDLESLGFAAIIPKPAPFDKLAEALAKLSPST
ncbi:MAG: response regulator [Polyangia bacterium]